MTDDARTERLRPVALHGMTFDVAGASAQGPRKENQDAFSIDAFAERGVVAVADGMGGERGGRVAAEMALGALMEGAEIRSLDAARFAIRHADEQVARAAQESPDERGGMGCALAMLSLAADRSGTVGWIVAHVGDVRILSRSPDGAVRLETRDHTQAYARWEAGEIALDEIPDSPGANRLHRAVGRGGEADAGWIPVRPGWSYLLLSDGVTKAMRLDELGQAMAGGSADGVVGSVMRKVAERGPDDNYTVVAVRVLDGAGGEATLPSPAPRRGAAAAPPPPAAESGPAPQNLFNPPTDPVKATRSSPLGWLATLLAVAALAVAGFAAYLAYARPGTDPALDLRVDSLRTEVRALRSLVEPDTVPVVPRGGAAPAGVDTQPGALPAPATPITQP
jgi:serine/threonine protein phosphatase PrpC